MLTISYLIALLSWHLIEYRFLRLKDRFSYKMSLTPSEAQACSRVPVDSHAVTRMPSCVPAIENPILSRDEVPKDSS